MALFKNVLKPTERHYQEVILFWRTWFIALLLREIIQHKKFGRTQHISLTKKRMQRETAQLLVNGTTLDAIMERCTGEERKH